MSEREDDDQAASEAAERDADDSGADSPGSKPSPAPEADDRDSEPPPRSAEKKPKKAPDAAPAGPFPLPRRTAHGLALLSGLLYFAAFPGIDVWPLAFVALAPLVVALRGQPPRRAAGIGWTAGFAMTMCGFYWLLEMLKTFSGFATPLCLLFMAILCGYQAGRIALMGYVAGRIEQKGWPAGVAFALAFVASELLYPLLFPWAYGATVHQVPVMLQLAELLGPIGVGLALVTTNLAVAEIAISRLEKRRTAWRKVLALAAVTALSVVYGAVRIPMVDAAERAAPKARVGIVQANMSLMGKRRDKSEGLRRHMELTRELQKEGPLDLVVWSETSVMAPQDEEIAPAVYRSQFAATLGAPAIFGAVLVRRVPDVREYVFFNSALLSDAKGEVAGRYDKQFLLAFGEYLPFGEQFRALRGPVDILVLNATPAQPLKPIEEYDWEFYQQMLDFFVKSPYLLSRACLPHMKAQRWGRIINIGSEVVARGVPNFTAYIAAKGAQNGFNRGLATEVARWGKLLRDLKLHAD